MPQTKRTSGITVVLTAYRRTQYLPDQIKALRNQTVTPHPSSQPHLWSCRPDFGKVVGRMGVATYKNTDHRSTRDDIVDAFRADGWTTVAQRQTTQNQEGQA